MDRIQYDNILEKLNHTPIPSISTDQAFLLSGPIQLSEVKDVVFDLPKNSSPGPDGYHASFYQKNWNLVSKNVFGMISSIWNFGHLLKATNKTNVVLIPKTTHPQTFKD